MTWGWILAAVVAYHLLPTVLVAAVVIYVLVERARRFTEADLPENPAWYVQRAVYYNNEIWLRYVDIYCHDIAFYRPALVVERFLGVDAWVWMWPLWILPRLRCTRRLFRREVPRDFRPTRRQPAGRRTWNYGGPS